MSVRDLFIQAPHLCGAHYADKRSTVAQIVWDHEMENKAFGRINGESAIDRIAFMFDWPCDNEDMREYCLQLGNLNVLAHYAKEHGDTDARAEADELKPLLESEEKNFPAVAKILTVEQAYSGWWGV
jgi:hypothetical protein